MEDANYEGLYSLFMFWYGFDRIRRSIYSYKYTDDMMRFQWDNVWFSKTKNIDTQIQKEFGYLVPLMTEFKPTNMYEKVGKMILYDQVVRNVFRNTAQAYKYDHIANNIAYDLLQDKSYLRLPICIKISIILTLVHSESIIDQQRVSAEINILKVYHPNFCVGIVKTLTEIACRHRQRIELFGRLPERARIKGCSLSDEELLFLKSVG